MKNLVIILTILLAGCAVNKQNTRDLISDNDFDLIEVKVTDNGGNISFVIQNISKEQLYILQPEKLHIEKFDNGAWSKLRVLPCPCGAPCARPSEKLEIPVAKNYIKTWDKNESWCGEENEYGIEETLKKKVENGKYRIRIIYKCVEEKNSKVIYNEFQI